MSFYVYVHKRKQQEKCSMLEKVKVAELIPKQIEVTTGRVL